MKKIVKMLSVRNNIIALSAFAMMALANPVVAQETTDSVVDETANSLVMVNGMNVSVNGKVVTAEELDAMDPGTIWSIKVEKNDTYPNGLLQIQTSNNPYEHASIGEFLGEDTLGSITDKLASLGRTAVALGGVALDKWIGALEESVGSLGDKPGAWFISLDNAGGTNVELGIRVKKGFRPERVVMHINGKDYAPDKMKSKMIQKSKSASNKGFYDGMLSLHLDKELTQFRNQQQKDPDYFLVISNQGTFKVPAIYDQE